MKECSLSPLHCPPFLYPLSVSYKDPKLSFPSWSKDSIVKGPSVLGQTQLRWRPSTEAPESQLWVKRHLLLGSWCPTLQASVLLCPYKGTQMNTIQLSHEKPQHGWLSQTHSLFPVDITIWQIPESLLSKVLRFGTKTEKGSASATLCTKPYCVTLYSRP